MSRSDAYITVECERCGEAIDVELTIATYNDEGAYSWDSRKTNIKLSEAGWAHDDEIGDICPACKE